MKSFEKTIQIRFLLFYALKCLAECIDVRVGLVNSIVYRCSTFMKYT